MYYAYVIMPNPTPNHTHKHTPNTRAYVAVMYYAYAIMPNRCNQTASKK